jgi:uncharacterized protein (DUF1800 family)
MLPHATHPWTLEEAGHLVRRAGFGGAPGEILKIFELGREQAVECLLEQAKDPEPVSLPAWAQPETMREDRRKWWAEQRARRQAEREMTPAAREASRRESQQQLRREHRRRMVDLAGWWLDLMIRSEAPLREKMVLFLHDHFATSARKVRQPLLMFEQNQRFRRHALGDFRQLTREMTTDPALMLYLDAQTSRKGKPNENFARELMELFVLGEGHYSEQDIREAARAFTGYKVNRLTGEVTHVRRHWDEGGKTILGRSGRFDGEAVVDLLFEHPAAASHLVAKLWSYFVEDDPPPVVVRELAATFRHSGFRLEAVLREIFLSRAFYDSTVRRNQIKSPVQFLVQLCRQLEVRDLPQGYTRGVLRELGQELFHPPNVAGWDWGRGWINTNTLLNRYNVAGVVTQGALNHGGEDGASMAMMSPGDRPAQQMLARVIKRSMQRWQGPDYERLAPRDRRADPEGLVDALMQRFFQSRLTPKQRAAFVDYARTKQGVVFTDREVAELCHLMMSTPHYQLT